MVKIAEVSIREVSEIVNASPALYEYTNFSVPPSLNSYYTFKNEFLLELKEELIELVMAPLEHPEMFWLLVPLIITLLVMEFYFGRYKREKLGWNTAVGNSLVLVYISINLFNYLYGFYQPAGLYELFTLSIKPWVALGVILEGLFLLLINYFHLLPDKLTFFLSSALPINLTAYVAIVFVYTRTEVDFVSIVAAVTLFFILLIAFSFIRLLEYEAPPDESDVQPVIYLKNE